MFGFVGKKGEGSKIECKRFMRNSSIYSWGAGTSKTMCQAVSLSWLPSTFDGVMCSDQSSDM